MNMYGRFTAAVGSVALNVALALILSQGARAATPSTNALAPAPESHAVHHRADHHAADGRCVAGLRARTIIAVLLGIIV